MEEEKKVPRHIGFIMDGNGRWAKLRGKSRSYGHKKGADVIEEVVSACFFEGVEAVSLYAFSTENWSRPKEEIDTIFDLLEKFLRRYENKLVNERIRLIISGDLSEISEKLRNRSISVMKNTERFVGKSDKLRRQGGNRPRGETFSRSRRTYNGRKSRGASVYGGTSGYRPRRKNERRIEAQQFFPVAMRLRGTLFYRRSLAGLRDRRTQKGSRMVCGQKKKIWEYH